MSTDNSKVLRNSKTDRSQFGINSSLRTTRNLGQISVHGLTFAMPKDTIKRYEGFHLELKPTTDRISSKIRFNRMSVACPLRSIWHYADSFIGKGGDILKNGAFSVPYIQGNEQTTVKTLPCMNSLHLLGYFLCAIGSRNTMVQARNRGLYSISPTQTYDNNMFPFMGNLQEWRFDFYSATRNCRRSYTNSTDLAISRVPWWLPRIVKGGLDETGVNLDIENNSTSGWALHLPATDVCSILNTTKRYFVQDSVLQNVCISANYDPTTHKHYFLVAFGCGESSLYAETRQPSSDYYTFSVDGITNSTLRYGTIRVNPNHIQNSTYTTDTDRYFLYSDEPDPMITGAKINYQRSNALFTMLGLTALFNNADMLGYGSLCEMLGVHYFKQTSLSEIYENFGQTNSLWCSSSSNMPYRNSQWRKLNFPFLQSCFYNDIQNGNDILSPKINVLPFYAYQKVVSDRFLLPHNILTNNVGQDTAVDSSLRFDNPYYRNNMVPTKCFWRPLASGVTTSFIDEDFMYYDDVTTNTSAKLHRISDGAAISTLDPTIWHYTQHINQLCTIFLTRNCLLNMDVTKKIWQRENMNVQNILNASQYGIVDSQQKLQAVAYNISRDILRFIRFGGTDQLAKDVIKNHFGVNDVPCDRNDIIVLHTDKSFLQSEDVTNTGGSVDASGQPMSLGDKVSIVTNTIPKSCKYTCFVPDFAFIIDLDWLDTEQFYTRVPNYATNELGNRLRIADDFRLALFPEYQNTGDVPFYNDQIEFGEYPTAIGWTAKNNILKDSDINEVSGEFQTTRYQRQNVGARPCWYQSQYAPSLTYGYLQPNSTEYNLPLVDTYGSALLLGIDKTLYKKSCLTKSNPIGL